MDFDLRSARSVLERTPRTLDAWLRDLPDEWVHADEGLDTFSPFDVVGHLVHGERSDWIARARMILDHGEAKTFEPFDRFAHEATSADESLAARLDEFARLRAANLDTLDAMGIGATDLARRGRHPAFGPVTLRQLLSTWVVHDLGHVAQISRVLAKVYASEVGPWAEFLPVLRR